MLVALTLICATALTSGCVIEPPPVIIHAKCFEDTRIWLTSHDVQVISRKLLEQITYNNEKWERDCLRPTEETRDDRAPSQ